MKDFKKYSKENIHFYSGDVSKLLLDTLSESKPKKIADFGCGDGMVLFSLKEKGILKECKEIIAIDLSRKRLERVKENIKEAKIIKSDVTKVDNIMEERLKKGTDTSFIIYMILIQA